MTREELEKAMDEARAKREALSGEELIEYLDNLDDGVIASCESEEGEGLGEKGANS